MEKTPGTTSSPASRRAKTGSTSEAGRCHIAKASRNGSDLLLVILNGKRRWNTAKNLIDYGVGLTESIGQTTPVAAPPLEVLSIGV